VPAPNTLPGCVLWFHAEDLSGLADNDPVSSWTSRVGTSVASASAPRIPTKQTVSGKHVVRFATDDRLTLNGDALSFSNGVGGITIAVRMKITSASGDNIFMISTGGSSTSSRAKLSTTGGGLLSTVSRRLDADSAAILNGGTPSGGIENYSAVWNYTSNDVRQYINNVEATSGSISTPGSTSATNSLFVGLGGEESAGADIDGDIYEVGVFNRALDLSQRSTLDDWLTTNTPEPIFFWLRQNMPLR